MSRGFAAYSISKLKERLSKIKNRLRIIRGVGKNTEELILEILKNKKSGFLKSYCLTILLETQFGHVLAQSGSRD